MSYNLILGNEIWLLIMELLDNSSLKALSDTSKQMHALGAPVMYSTINLSIHHTITHLDPRDESLETQWQDVQKVLGRQNLFMQQIFARPELALLVQTFTWTMGLHKLCSLPQWAKTGGTPIDEFENIDTLFQSLRHVVNLDIHGGDFHDYPCLPYQNLFPEAAHIRLSGQMHYRLAWAILCGPNKVPLKSLTLHNLLERGRFEGGENFEPQFDPRLRGIKRLLPFEESWPENGFPVQVAPGEMTHLLGPALQSRCANLRHLTFGVLDLTPEYRHRILPPGWVVRTSAIHEDLIDFLRKIHPQKVEIVYSKLSPERHQELKSLYWKRHCRIPPRPPNQAQHTLFELLSEGWEGLESLKIQGGQRGPDFQGHLEILPSPAGRPIVEKAQIIFEPNFWEDYHGRIRTS